MTTTAKTRRTLLLCSVIALGSAACAEGGPESNLDPERASDVQASAPAALQSEGEQIRIASVSVNGSGCPAGSYESFLSEDGLALTITFSKYFLEASATKPVVQTLACNVSLQLAMPRGYQVGVTKVSYQGYAFLEPGLVAEQIANYAWTGIGTLANNEARSKLTGPHDGSYLFNDEVETRGGVIPWSPCDLTSRLQIRSRLTLTNNVRGEGYINTTDVNVEQKTKLVINLRKQVCPAKR